MISILFSFLFSQTKKYPCYTNPKGAISAVCVARCPIPEPYLFYPKMLFHTNEGFTSHDYTWTCQHSKSVGGSYREVRTKTLKKTNTILE